MESYAVIKTGGKQYRVKPGDTIRIERLPAEIGAEITLAPVLAVNDGQGFRLGTPEITDLQVTGTVTDRIRDRKVISFKHKRRKGYRRKIGHRQHLTVCRIDAIGATTQTATQEEQESDHGA